MHNIAFIMEYLRSSISNVVVALSIKLFVLPLLIGSLDGSITVYYSVINHFFVTLVKTLRIRKEMLYFGLLSKTRLIWALFPLCSRPHLSTFLQTSLQLKPIIYFLNCSSVFVVKSSPINGSMTRKISFFHLDQQLVFLVKLAS